MTAPAPKLVSWYAELDDAIDHHRVEVAKLEKR